MTLRSIYRDFISPQRWLERIGLRAPMQIVIGLVLLSTCILLFAEDFGLLVSDDDETLHRRVTLTEVMARSVARAVWRADFASINDQLTSLVGNNDVLSIGLQKDDGTMVAQTPDHPKYWAGALRDASDPTHIQLALWANQHQWGKLEIAFSPPPRESGWKTWCLEHSVRLIAFILFSEFVLFWLYLSRMLRMLDPSAAIPNRMQLLMDTLVEGMVVLDNRGFIVMANHAIAQIAFCSADQLMGRKLSSLQWEAGDEEGEGAVYPWESESHGDLQLRSVPMTLRIGTRHTRRLNVNISPILGPEGKRRGVLVTFVDQTVVEKDNAQLLQLLTRFSDAGECIHLLRGQIPLEGNRELDQLEDLARSAKELAQLSAAAAKAPITSGQASPEVGFSK